MRHIITATAAIGMAALLISGCAAPEAATKPEPAAAPIVKSTPPKPVVPQSANEAPLPAAAKPAAPAAATAGADVITLPASNGPVTLSHKKHQEMLKGCMSCHAQSPGRIAGLGKDWAHATCKGCHSEMKAGPVSCSGCHRK